MKIIFAFLFFLISVTSFADAPNQARELKLDTPSNDSKLKSIISQKSIQSVLKTVEILKEKEEMAYQKKKSKASSQQSI